MLKTQYLIKEKFNLKIKDGFMLRQVCDDYMVIPVGTNSIEFKSVIRLNETGAFLFERLKSDTTQEALVADMLDEYNVEKELAVSDINMFLKSLENAGILE